MAEPEGVPEFMSRDLLRPLGVLGDDRSIVFDVAPVQSAVSYPQVSTSARMVGGTPKPGVVEGIHMKIVRTRRESFRVPNCRW